MYMKALLASPEVLGTLPIFLGISKFDLYMILFPGNPNAL